MTKAANTVELTPFRGGAYKPAKRKKKGASERRPLVVLFDHHAGIVVGLDIPDPVRIVPADILAQ